MLSLAPKRALKAFSIDLSCASGPINGTVDGRDSAKSVNVILVMNFVHL